MTPRQHDTLELLLKGLSNKEIAEELGLQVITVKMHVRNVCSAYGVKTRFQLMALFVHSLR